MGFEKFLIGLGPGSAAGLCLFEIAAKLGFEKLVKLELCGSTSFFSGGGFLSDWLGNWWNSLGWLVWPLCDSW